MPPKHGSKRQSKEKPKSAPVPVSAPGTTKPESPPPKAEPRKTWVELLALPMGLLTLAAVSSPLSQATLSPVFGAIPSAINHQTAVLATSLLGFFLRIFAPRPPAGRVGQILAVWAFWVPVLSTYLFRWSGYLGPAAGPALIGFLSCHTILIPAVYAAAEALEKLNLERKLGPYATPVVTTGLGVFHVVSFERQFSTALPNLATVSQIFTPVKLQMLLASTLAYLSPSKLSLLVFPAMIHTFLANPHFDSGRTMSVLNASLAEHNYSILDRRWSNTGYISVLEGLDAQYRVMRCDHSLLGGEWLLTDERRDKEGWLVNESIYSVFEMLEAVRLIEDPLRKSDNEAQALVIGLGIGTAPKAFINHGINTTIVEVDPIVHEFATTYFALPSNHTFVNHDAIYWASNTVSQNLEQGISPQQYDYIIHDVFTGGAEPLSLFTESFLRNLRTLLTPHGAIALNYAGDVNFPLTAKVMSTIDHVFEGRCKIFRDSPSAAETAGNEKAHDDFTNIIIFCRNTAGPIEFRAPTKADLLGSKSREHYLFPNPRLEIPFPLQSEPNRRQRVQQEALQDGEEQQWSTQQADSAVKHWYVMRTVMPDAIWELW